MSAFCCWQLSVLVFELASLRDLRINENPDQLRRLLNFRHFLVYIRTHTFGAMGNKHGKGGEFICKSITSMPLHPICQAVRACCG